MTIKFIKKTTVNKNKYLIDEELDVLDVLGKYLISKKRAIVVSEVSKVIEDRVGEYEQLSSDELIEYGLNSTVLENTFNLEEGTINNNNWHFLEEQINTEYSEFRRVYKNQDEQIIYLISNKIVFDGGISFTVHTINKKV